MIVPIAYASIRDPCRLFSSRRSGEWWTAAYDEGTYELIVRYAASGVIENAGNATELLTWVISVS